MSAVRERPVRLTVTVMFDVEGLAQMDAMFFEVEGRWPDRPALDLVLRARSREIAEALLEQRQSGAARA